MLRTQSSAISAPSSRRRDVPDARGCPEAVSVFEGNTADPKTLLPRVEKVRDAFGIASLVIINGACAIARR